MIKEKEPYWRNIDFDDIEKLNKLMDNADDFDEALFGRSDCDELVLTSIFKDKIVVETFQTNGWVQKSTYERADGNITRTTEYYRDEV